MLLEVLALLHIRLLASPSHTREKVLVFSELLKAYYAQLLLFYHDQLRLAPLLLQWCPLPLSHVVVLTLLLKRALVMANGDVVVLLDSDAVQSRRRRRLTRRRQRRRWRLNRKLFDAQIFHLLVLTLLLTLLYGFFTSAMVSGLLVFHVRLVFAMQMFWSPTSLLATLPLLTGRTSS